MTIDNSSDCILSYSRSITPTQLLSVDRHDEAISDMTSNLYILASNLWHSTGSVLKVITCLLMEQHFRC